MKSFAEKLKSIRLEKGLKIKEVSKLLDLSENAFGNYEKGLREPSLETLKRICQLFDVTADYLIGLSEY